ncbi:hypothetical protein Tco_1040801, partial [Tanacetum coccineum]
NSRVLGQYLLIKTVKCGDYCFGANEFLLKRSGSTDKKKKASNGDS